MQTILKHGELGWDVAMLQWRLGLLPSGYYNDYTRDEVINWQTTHHLTADGEVGRSRK